MKLQILVKNILFIVVVYVCSTTRTFARVGIATTSPKASLDIVASNQASPASNDGILIPRVDAFSAIKPTIDQDAMIVYLTTIDGTDAPGFYYWNNTTTSWLPFGGVSHCPAISVRTFPFLEYPIPVGNLLSPALRFFPQPLRLGSFFQ